MKKVLIVEDEKILADLLQKRLKEEGYEVFLAFDGEEGFKAIKKQKPDLILLDIVMPKIGGFELMEILNKDPEVNLKKIPVIIISNSGQPVEINRAIELGIRDYLIKTEFDPTEVIEKVKKQIG